ncbi:MAG: hypothetical protein NTAFB09_22150 [Nitrosospira sp.]
MPKLGPLQIPDNVLDAIRDDRLVIFAGAGVSVGHPANLPDFVNLALEIAEGTGFVRRQNEPVDHFLGHLQPAKGSFMKIARNLILMGGTDSGNTSSSS